jgi:hypothetical protein
MSVLGASFSIGYWVSISSMQGSHEQLDMGPWFTMAVGLIENGSYHLSMRPWFSSLLQHYGPHIALGPWYMVVNQALKTTLS